MTSIPHSSWRRSMEPSDETASTSSSAGWPARVDRAPDLRQAAGDAGRRFVVDHQHRADAMVAVLAQPRLERCRIDAVPPVSRHDLHVESQPARDCGPSSGELSDVEGEHAIPGRQRVDERRFPRAGAGGGEHHDRLHGLEDSLQPVEHGAAQRRELGAPMIDGRLRHRAEHAIRRVGGTGNLQEVAAAPMHGRR